MEQDDGQQPPRRGDGKNFTILFWFGFVLSFFVYNFVENNPLVFFGFFTRYTLIVLLPITMLALLLQNTTNRKLKAVYGIMQKFNILILERIKLFMVGFVLGFMLLLFMFYIIPQAKIAHTQHVKQMQKIH